MKVSVKISGLSKEELVDFLSTALYGNPVFQAYVEDASRHLTQGETCYEDKLASALLKGGKIVIVDAEGEEINGPAKGVDAKLDEEQAMAEYTIDLKAVQNGLKRALECFEPSAFRLLENDGSFDAFDADLLLQYIVFGEVVYA